MNKCRSVFESLKQVGVNGIRQNNSHCAVSLQIGGGDCLTIVVQTDNNLRQTFAQVLKGGCQRKNHHDFRGTGNIKSGLSGHAVNTLTQTDYDVAQGAVVHVDNAAPLDSTGVETQVITLVQVVIDHGGQKVVSRGNGVEITGQMQI